MMLTSKSMDLKSAFFRIYVVTGISDILGIIALEWVRAEMKSSFGPTYELLTRLAMTMTGINFVSHILGCLLMTLNRFTAVCYPHQYRSIWSTRNVCMFLIIAIIIAIIVHIEALTTHFLYESTADGGWTRVGRSGSIDRVRITSSALTIGYEAVSIVLISCTIYAMNKQLRESGHKLTQDMSLVFVTTINCILSILECIYDISSLFSFQSPVIEWITGQYAINLFLVMTTNAYSIIFLSYSLRQEIRQRWRKSSKIQSVTSLQVF
ncbi:hypothetical protein V3C99_014838 [Haemonchus contortus]